MNPSMTESRRVLRSVKKRSPAQFAALMEEFGFTTLAEPKPTNDTSGRLGKPRNYYRQVADEYRRAVSKGSRHPNQDVALALGLDSASKARDAVYRARQMELLPRTVRGRMKS